jgi:predicted PurR-regulated permease PerM
MLSSRPYTFDRVVRLVIGLIVITLVFLLLKRLSNVLLPFLIAWLLAYLLHPIVNFFQYKLKFKNRLISVITTLVTITAILAGFIFMLIPLVGNEFSKLSEIIGSYSQNLNIDKFLPIAWQNDLRSYFSEMDLKSVLNDKQIMDVVKQIAPKLWEFLNGSLSLIFGMSVLIIVLLYLIFILLDYEKVSNGIFNIIPVKYRPIASEIIGDIESGMNRYFRGQALVALISGLLCAIGFYFTGLPLAIVFGLFVGVLTLVPYLKTIALIPGLFLAYLQSVETGQSFGSIILWVSIVFIAVQVIEDLFLVPKIMGKVTGLNPAVILLSLSVWGSLMGFAGLIIALPFTSLIISYYKRFVLKEETEKEIIAEDIQQTIISDTEI